VTPDSKDIKFPTQHYVTFQTRPDEDGAPLGFMVPDGTDSAAKARKDSADKWAKGYGYGAENTGALPAQTYENKPMNGFKLGRSLRHGGGGWGQGNVKWRIEDPRGFELEITSPNLAQIMSCTTIENGEILDQCMWARLKSDNVLVPVSSEVYKAAQANTERAGKKASMSDLKLGDHVVMQNGTEGTYLGCYWIGSDGFTYYNIVTAEIRRKSHLFYVGANFRRESYGTREQEDAVRSIADPKLAEIHPTATPMTPQEAEALVQHYIENGTDFETATSNYGGRPDYALFNTGKKPKDLPDRVLEPLDITPFTTGTDDRDLVFVAEQNGVWFIAGTAALNGASAHWHIHRGYDFTANAFDKAAYDADGTFKHIMQAVRAGYYRTDSYEQTVSMEIKVADITNAHAIRVTTKSPVGNDISYLAKSR
jgi:hypothetical protein